MSRIPSRHQDSAPAGDTGKRATIAQFSNPDASRQATALIDFLDRFEQLPQTRELRLHTYERLGAPPGAGIDIGCGCGGVVDELAQRGLSASGLDLSQAMVDAARRRFPHYSFGVGDALALELPNAQLGWYRAERVYQHIANPEAGLAEAYRVLAPNGRILLADPDWDTHVIHAYDPALSRKIVRAFADGLANGRAGTRSAEQLANTGFVDIEVTIVVSLYRQLAPISTLLIEPIANAAVAAGAISDNQARAWLKELQQLDQRGCFIAQASKFVTTARRPA